MKHGKKYVESAKLIDRTKLYDAPEALELSVKTATAKFDETIEAHIRLGVDSRHADQQVRGAVVLPNGTGKNDYFLCRKIYDDIFCIRECKSDHGICGYLFEVCKRVIPASCYC